MSQPCQTAMVWAGGAGMIRYAGDMLRFIRIAAVFFCIGKALPIALVMAVEALS
jgi:hypothetical protein